MTNDQIKKAKSQRRAKIRKAAKKENMTVEDFKATDGFLDKWPLITEVAEDDFRTELKKELGSEEYSAKETSEPKARSGSLDDFKAKLEKELLESR